MLSILRRPPHAEVRLTQEQRRYASISTATLQYMLECGIFHEAWLRWQLSFLNCEADEEADLYEAMRLSERLSRVGRNVRRVSGETDLLRSELVSRTPEDG